MPTSKDILKDAQKVLDTAGLRVGGGGRSLRENISQCEDDMAAFGKARAGLSSSIASIKQLTDLLEDDVKDLNKGLTTLQKNEAVMLAPADAKAYKKLVDEMKSAIKDAMSFNKDLGALSKKAEDLMKR